MYPIKCLMFLKINEYFIAVEIDLFSMYEYEIKNYLINLITWSINY